jgi:hypothetical protein
VSAPIMGDLGFVTLVDTALRGAAVALFLLVARTAQLGRD